MRISEKEIFLSKLKAFVNNLAESVSKNDEWTIRGFIDVLQNIYSLSSDTKVISKILEIHLFPYFLEFAKCNGYRLELAAHQNWYPDMTFILKEDEDVKFAVDIKTTYRDNDHEGFCNGFTLGSHGEYFRDRQSSKNIQYPYGEYCGHFCVGIIYTRGEENTIDETRKYGLEELEHIPAVAKNFLFFAEEKWKIASDKGGSGNTANIGSINYIEDIVNGNGIFAKAGEEVFDDYWANFGLLQIKKGRKYEKLSSFEDYLKYKKMPMSLYNSKHKKEKKK